MYLTEKEHSVLAKLPAHELSTNPCTACRPSTCDVFEDTLVGLILAEVELIRPAAIDALRTASLQVRRSFER